MGIVKGKLQNEEKRKNSLIHKVSTEHVRPTDEEQEAARQIIDRIANQFAEKMVTKSLRELEPELQKAIREEVKKLGLPFEEQLRVTRTVEMTILGNGPIEELLKNPEVTEIVVQRWDNVVYEERGHIYQSDIAFNSEEHLITIINRIVQAVNRQINIMNPIVDARLPDGSRVNATIPPVSPDGATLTIRKFSQRALTGQDYLDAGSLDERMLYFLERCVAGKITLFVSGGTGTGKTTMLNMLSQFIPKDELIITIEDTLELKLQQPNVRRMEVRLSSSKDMMQVDQRMLVKAALRQRPDRIILGETRDGSVVDLISAMSTGHEGSMSTIHANSPENMVNVRIPILYSMNEEANFSEKSIAMQVAEAIQVIVQLSRMPDGSRKVTEIGYVKGLKPDGKVDVKDLFVYNRETQKFEATGVVPNELIYKIRLRGLDFQTDIFSHDKEDEQ